MKEDTEKTYSRKVAAEKYNFMRDVPDRVMEEYARIVLDKSEDEGRVIDVGFGTGLLLLPLVALNENSEIYGIDASEEMFSLVGERLEQGEVDLACAEVSSLKDKESKFDVLHFKAILHCIDEPEEALDAMASAVKPGGYIISAHEESQSEDRLEQIFNYAQIDSPELELIFEYYFQLRTNMKKPFLWRDYPAGDSRKAMDYFSEHHGFTLEEEITNTSLEWNRTFTLNDVLQSMRLGTFGVFHNGVSKDEREEIYSQLLKYTERQEIGLDREHTIPAGFRVYISSKPQL